MSISKVATRKYKPESISVYSKYSKAFYTMHWGAWTKSLAVTWSALLPLVTFKKSPKNTTQAGSVVDFFKANSLQLELIYCPHEVNQLWIRHVLINYKAALQHSSRKRRSGRLTASCINFTWFSLPSILDERMWGSTVEEMKGSKGREVSKTFSPLTEVQGVWRSAGLSFNFRENHPSLCLWCFSFVNDRSATRCPRMPQEEQPSLLIALSPLFTSVVLVSLTLDLFPCLCWLTITPGKGGHGAQMEDVTSSSALYGIALFWV